MNGSCAQAEEELSKKSAGANNFDERGLVICSRRSSSLLGAFWGTNSAGFYRARPSCI
jgi:hypothetical protein